MGYATIGVRRAMVGATLAAVLLAGCNKKPEGQVVATVNGDEVTRRDLTSEIAANGAGNADEAKLKAVQPVLVEGVVNRKLLVQEAKRSNLDKDPQYLAMKQRADEILLAQMLAQSWSGKIQRADAATVRAFIDANPLMFGERKVLLVDEIAVEASGVQPAQLAALKTSDAIAAWLSAQKKPFQRANKTVDTLRMPRDTAAQIVAQSQGAAPLIVPNGAVLNILSVRAVRPMPVPANQLDRIAREALQQQEGMKTIQAQLKRLHETADISYLPEYAPKGSQSTAK